MLARDFDSAYSNPAVPDALAQDIHDYVIALRGMPGVHERCSLIATAARLPELLLLFLPGAVEHGLRSCPPSSLAAMTETARNFDMRYSCPLARIRVAAGRDRAGSALHESLLAAEIEAERNLISRLTIAAYATAPCKSETIRSTANKRENTLALFTALPVGTVRIAPKAYCDLVDIAFPLSD